jgi:NhaP-type Na+/H+ or K+/H+ antiporter
MKCGRRTEDYVVHTFVWYPPWVIIFVLFCSPLVLIIVALLIAKRMTVDSPMCEQHRNHWKSRTLFTWVGFGGVVALGIIFTIVHRGMDPENNPQGEMSTGGIMALIWFATFFIWLFAAAIFTQSAIRPFEITENDITLGKLSPDFVDALEDDRDRHEEKRRERRRLEREDDRDDRDRDDWGSVDK